MNTQPRAPMGTPEGGQFAATSRPDAAADVTHVPMNSDGSHGSIYFPERLHSADEHLQWWSTVPVPDEVLQTAMDDYSNSRVMTINSIVGKWEARPKQPGRSKAEYEARAKESAQQHNQRYAQWEQRDPEKLDRFDVRDAVRMHLAWTYRHTLPAEEQTLLVHPACRTTSSHRTSPGHRARHHRPPRRSFHPLRHARMLCPSSRSPLPAPRRQCQGAPEAGPAPLPGRNIRTTTHDQLRRLP